MNTLFTVLSLAANLAIVLYTGDTLRRMFGLRHALISAACILVCVGAFGGICSTVRFGPSPYDLVLSIGVALYCVHRRYGGDSPA